MVLVVNNQRNINSAKNAEFACDANLIDKDTAMYFIDKYKKEIGDTCNSYKKKIFDREFFEMTDDF